MDTADAPATDGSLAAEAAKITVYTDRPGGVTASRPDDGTKGPVNIQFREGRALTLAEIIASFDKFPVPHEPQPGEPEAGQERRMFIWPRISGRQREVTVVFAANVDAARAMVGRGKPGVPPKEDPLVLDLMCGSVPTQFIHASRHNPRVAGSRKEG